MKNKEKVIETGKLILSDDTRFNGELLCVDTLALGDERFALLLIDADKDNRKVNSIFVSTYDEYGNCIYDGFNEYDNIKNQLDDMYDDYCIALSEVTYNIVDYISTNGSRYICAYFFVANERSDRGEKRIVEIKYRITNDLTLSLSSISEIDNCYIDSFTTNISFEERYAKTNGIFTCFTATQMSDDHADKILYKNNDTGQVFFITDVIDQSVFNNTISYLNSIMDKFNSENNNEYHPSFITRRMSCFPDITVRSDGSFVAVTSLFFRHKRPPISKSFTVPVFHIFNPRLNTYNVYVDMNYRIPGRYYSDYLENNSVTTLNKQYVSYTEMRNNEAITTIVNINTFERRILRKDDTDKLFVDTMFEYVKDKISDAINDDKYVVNKRFLRFLQFENSEYISSSFESIWHGAIALEYTDDHFNIKRYIYIEVTLSIPDLKILTIKEFGDGQGFTSLTSIALRSFVKAKWYYIKNIWFSCSEVTFGRYRYIGDYLLNDDILLKNVKDADPEPDDIHYGEPIYNVINDGLYENK